MSFSIFVIATGSSPTQMSACSGREWVRLTDSCSHSVLRRCCGCNFSKFTSKDCGNICWKIRRIRCQLHGLEDDGEETDAKGWIKKFKWFDDFFCRFQILHTILKLVLCFIFMYLLWSQLSKIFYTKRSLAFQHVW